MTTNNSNCYTCDVEYKCGYRYKPCDCCNYRKFVPKPTEKPVNSSPVNVVKFVRKEK